MDRLRLLLIVRAWVFACVSVGMPLKELTNSQQYLQIKKKKGTTKRARTTSRKTNTRTIDDTTGFSSLGRVNSLYVACNGAAFSA